jgi:alkylated DNA repair dioxygenase AlkB
VADPGCSYRYSGLDQVITPWSPPLEKLRDRLEQVLGLRFNSLLLNRYRTGADRMGWHADDEPELDAGAPIASLSLGVSRPLIPPASATGNTPCPSACACRGRG